MADKLTKEQRSKNMRAIKSKDTKIEVILRKELFKRGYRYRKNVKGLPGTPDIVFIKERIAIFVDGEFFHGDNWEDLKPNLLKGSNSDFWISKIERNMERDMKVNQKLRFSDWIVLRFWGKDIKRDLSSCISIIEEEIRKKRQKISEIEIEDDLKMGFKLEEEEKFLMEKKLEIRKAEISDLEEISAIEKECFPPLEAASQESFIDRLNIYKNHFDLLFVDDKMVSFIDGFCTDEKDLTDEMYEDVSMHKENGKWQMIFGINTLPEYRNKGYASMLIRSVIEDAKKEKRLGIVLTCKKEKISFYESFGFINEGISESVHGNTTWYQMRITF